MVVNFTSNIGLAKPDNNEVAKNWTHTAKLCEDNNLILVDKTDITLTAYTPVIKAQTSDPNVGSLGGQFGEYQDIEGFIMGRFTLSFSGTGISGGSGEYGISLPAVVDNSFHIVGTAFNATPGSFSVVGEGYLYDASNVGASGSLALDVVTVSGVSYVRFLTELHTVPAKTSRLVRDGMPIAVADGDIINANFIYKKL